MNQKMPYFGLHDQKHLVCLSRNRMYVNLMNLESGDCVTTFKAGEDRFLNSLLVSGDGRYHYLYVIHYIKFHSLLSESLEFLSAVTRPKSHFLCLFGILHKGNCCMICVYRAMIS